MTTQYERDRLAWQADQDEMQRKLADYDRLRETNAELLEALQDIHSTSRSTRRISANLSHIERIALNAIARAEDSK